MPKNEVKEKSHLVKPLGIIILKNSLENNNFRDIFITQSNKDKYNQYDYTKLREILKIKKDIFHEIYIFMLSYPFAHKFDVEIGVTARFTDYLTWRFTAEEGNNFSSKTRSMCSERFRSPKYQIYHLNFLLFQMTKRNITACFIGRNEIEI